MGTHSIPTRTGKSPSMRGLVCVLLILACSLTSVHGLGAPLDGLLDGDVTLAARTDDEDLALDADVSGSVCMDFESILRKMHLDWLLGSLRSVIKTLFGSMRPCCHCDVKSIPKFYKALDGVERSMKWVPSAGNLLIALKSVRRCVENKCSKKAPFLRSLFKHLKLLRGPTSCTNDDQCLQAHSGWGSYTLPTAPQVAQVSPGAPSMKRRLEFAARSTVGVAVESRSSFSRMMRLNCLMLM